MIANDRKLYMVGLDVGSTTVKGIVVDSTADRILWQDYRRHEARQPESVLDFLTRMEDQIGIAAGNARIFITGSGGNSIASLIGAKFVQEVNAVSLAVEKLYPEVNSVIELGGQDAKIIVFKEDRSGGRKRKIPSMNDKCAGGTGAVIDKIASKLKISCADLCDLGYDGIPLHPVAGKCGVFAETDINGLQKQGVPPEQLLASLFEAIVLQNLTVLARGNTLRPSVLLLGGPNAFIRGMREAWRHNIPLLWKERQIQLPAVAEPEELIAVPENALYFAAIGAVEYGRQEHPEVGQYAGLEVLAEYLSSGRQREKYKSGSPALVSSEMERKQFERAYRPLPCPSQSVASGERIPVWIGLDGGSTTTKAVLLSKDGRVVCKAYQLSQGNPIQDTKQIFESLRRQIESRNAGLEVMGIVTTGYAKEILRDTLHADAALVETVAHARSALHFFSDPHCIVDVGGQDIKIIVLRGGRIQDFRLNTQCSAGNGYFLQSTAEALGIPFQDYARAAFSARSMPVFGYGCAVFLQSDIVNFQRQGWRAEEILAGLAAVLPKNIFLHVANVPNVARLGSRFVLQGGTQNNLAVVKAEVDFLREHFADSLGKPEIAVHPHCAEAGAIGAALEALRQWQHGRKTSFIGFDAVEGITYRSTRSEETRCHFCKNACLRTFVDVGTGSTEAGSAPSFSPGLPLLPGERRMIIAGCEKGAVEDIGSMREIKAGLDGVRAANPNLVEYAAREVWKTRKVELVCDSPPANTWRRSVRKRIALMNNRPSLRIGIPRVLNMYAYAPLFSVYLQSLGVRPENIVYSDFTTDEMYRGGSSRGAIDPCFPSKITIAHVHNLIFAKHARRPLHAIFLPMFDVLCSPLVRTRACNACPTVAVTPETVEAAYKKEIDVFAQYGLKYLHPLVNLSDRKLFARQMFRCWSPLLGLSEEENDAAVSKAFEALHEYEASVRRRAREVLDLLERENRLGVVMLGRPYHHDPGVNHCILEEFQKLGYPIFSQNTLPLDEDILQRLFGEEIRSGQISHPLDISDVWPVSTAASSNLKIWAAKFTARHPNLVAVEISSFKCGHDAPIYSVVERIVEQSGTPYFCFKDLDENKPVASIKIRVETIAYFLRQYREEILSQLSSQTEIERQLSKYKSVLEDHLKRQTELAADSPRADGSLSLPL